MITLSKSGSTVTFTFDENSGYLQNGTIDVPVNSLSLITDESDMATFRKAASNDIFISARYEEFGMTKSELESWYKENMVGATGGGGGGVTSGEVQTMIDENISGITDDIDDIELAVAGAVNDLNDRIDDLSGNSITSGDVQNAISGKVDTTVYTAYTAATDSVLSGKQKTIEAGRGISLTTGATADTVSLGFPISASTGVDSLLMSGSGNTASGNFSVAYGKLNTVSGECGVVMGNRNTSNNFAEFAIGQKNVSRTEDASAFGHSGNTLFSVGNGIINEEQGIDANHNAFEIRGNGDIYIADTNSSGGYYQKPMIKLQDAIGGSGSGCTVNETIVYNTFDSDMFDYQGEYKYEYAIIDFKGDKTIETKGLYFIAGNTSGDYASGYIYLDYPNHSASTDDNTAMTEYFVIEYISDINDFKISIAPAYQSTCWIKTIQNLYNTEVKVEFYKINSGSPCTVIETDVVGLVEKVKGITDSSVKNVSITSQKNKLETSFTPNKGYGSTSIVKLEEIDGTNSILKPAIKIPLGVSGWTELSFSEACTLYDVNATTIRVTYDYETFNADYMYLSIVSDTDGWEHYDNVTFSWETELPTFSSDYFTTGVTMTWSASTKELVVEYPATVEEGGSVKNVKITRLNSSNCQLGQFVSKVEAYGELKQDLKPYVQETRAALNNINDRLSEDEEVTAAALNNINDRLSEDEEVTAAGLNTLNEALGGLKLQQITQSAYDALVTKDASTLYIIVN